MPTAEEPPEWMPRALADLVGVESPSADAAATDECARVAAALVRERLGARPESVRRGGRRHLRWSWGEPRVLVLGHLDTVWPSGTLARWPFRVDGDTATGPGAFDMKGGVVQAVRALEALGSLDGVRLLLTTDEEIGSPTSADLVVDSARGCRAVLVCEPSGAGGALKTARKGIAMHRVEVTGRAAHAGLEPERGANAAVAAALVVLRAPGIGDPLLGTTVTPTLVAAGTAVNTVPPAATVSLDVRSAHPEEFRRVERELAVLCAAAEREVPGTRVVPDGGVNRPPLDERSSRDLFARAAALADRLGVGPLAATASGGASDGNFTAGAGVPTLDGLGAVGDGAHAEGEHLLLSRMEPRARLLAALVDEARTAS